MMGFGIILLLALFLLSVPVSLSLGIAPIPAVLEKGLPLIVLPQTIFEAMDSFALMAIPYFVLAGRLMQSGGIAKRLIHLGMALIGWVKGGWGPQRCSLRCSFPRLAVRRRLLPQLLVV